MGVYVYDAWMDALDEHFARRGALTQAQSTLNDSAQQVMSLYYLLMFLYL
jgi:hypothetical protein